MDCGNADPGRVRRVQSTDCKVRSYFKEREEVETPGVRSRVDGTYCARV